MQSPNSLEEALMLGKWKEGDQEDSQLQKWMESVMMVMTAHKNTLVYNLFDVTGP